MNARAWFVAIALSFLVGVFVGCGDITATMVEPPPAAAGPDGGTMDAGAGADLGSAALANRDAGGESSSEVESAHDGGGSELAPPIDAGAPEHPALHCQGAAADYRLTVCKPGCGTCQKIGEASTFAAGCWTSDDFHCVDACGECR